MQASRLLGAGTIDSIFRLFRLLSQSHSIEYNTNNRIDFAIFFYFRVLSSIWLCIDSTFKSPMTCQQNKPTLTQKQHLRPPYTPLQLWWRRVFAIMRLIYRPGWVKTTCLSKVSTLSVLASWHSTRFVPLLPDWLDGDNQLPWMSACFTERVVSSLVLVEVSWKVI